MGEATATFMPLAAHHLRAAGVGPGSRAGVRMTSMPDDATQDAQEAVVSESQGVVGGAGEGSQGAVAAPLEEAKAECGDGQRVGVLMVDEVAWGAGHGGVKEEHLAEAPGSRASVYPCDQPPQEEEEEEEVMLNLEEVEAGICLVGEPEATPATPSSTTTTFTLFAAHTMEAAHSQGSSRLLPATQDVSIKVEGRFGGEPGDGTQPAAGHSGGEALAEGCAQTWLGCCLCFEMFPSRETLHLHVTTMHQQHSSLPFQIPVTLALPHNGVDPSQGLLDASEAAAVEPDGANLESITMRDRPTFWPLPVTGKLMGISQVLDILKRADEVLESIPVGEKSNVFFVVKKKLKSGRLSCRDDCGDWSSKDSRSVDSYFLLDSEGNFKNVYLKNKLYVTQTRKMKKTIWIPLKPQPPEGSILKIHRFYSNLKANADYMKRVTCIQSGNVDYSDRMLVEYCGVYVKPQSDLVSRKRIRKTHHSGVGCEACGACEACRDENDNTRTHHQGSCHSNRLDEATTNDKSTKQKQDEKFQVSNLVDYTLETRAVFNQNVTKVSQNEAEHNCDDKPQTLRQVIYQRLQDAMDKKGPGFRYHFIEEIAEVLEMLKNDVDVQEIVDRRNQPPCVILYTTEQLCDMISEVESDSVIGINRTIDFGACHLTIAVYKSSKVIHRQSEKSPLLLGPMYLHWDGDFATYFPFFAHLKSVLGRTAVKFEIRAVDGDEAVLIKALQRCFPQAECTLCPKHLRDCLREHLADVATCEPDDENVIVNKIFGNAGVLMSKDVSVFEKRVSDLQVYFDKFPTFKTYFDNLMPVLSQHMWEPSMKGVSVDLWTSNNREPVNLVTKLTINWRSQKLAALIRKICSVSRKQLLDMKRSLYDPGNYVLLERYKSFAVNKGLWQENTQEEQDIIFMKFLKKCMPTDFS